MLLQFILFAATCIFLYFTHQQAAFSPVRMFLYGWLVVLGITASGMVRYENPLAITTFALVLASLFAFVIGAYFAPKRPPDEEPPFGKPRDDIDRVLLGFLCALASVGVVLVLQDLFEGGFAVIANFGAESSRVRNDYWSNFAEGDIAVSPVRSAGIVACLAVATLLPYARKCKNRTLQLVSVIAVVVIFAESLMVAGRFTLAVLAFCLLVSATLVYGRKSAIQRVFTIRRVVVGGAIGFYFFVVFPIQRNPYLADNVERSLSYAGDAYFPEWVKETSNIPGFSWFEVFAYSTSYFSTSLDKLNYFTTETDILSWYRLGLYNGTQISQVSGIFSDEVTPWHRIRLDIAEMMSFEGWAPNPWATGIRDIGIDFGLFAVLAIGLLGYFAQLTYNRSIAGRSFIGLITAIYVSVGCLCFAFISPFQIRIISNGFWLLALIVLARFALVRAMGNRNPGPMMGESSSARLLAR